MGKVEQLILSSAVRYFKRLKSRRRFFSENLGNYAFVGTGSHSTINLYPVLNYLHVPIKYIVTKRKRSAQTVSNASRSSKATTNLQDVLSDDSIRGVLISIRPVDHYSTIVECFNSQKHVFAEKPPCKSLSELHELIRVQKENDVHCVVGLQKRYSPFYRKLKTKIEGVISYNLKFLTGPYPEGDALTELFIHPLDLVCFLFGKGTVKSVHFTKSKGSMFIHLQHQDVVGTLELSTEYSWRTSVEELHVNTKAGFYRAVNLDSLVFEQRPLQISGVPTEKIFDQKTNTEQLFSRKGHLPDIHNTHQYVSGYYHELSYFIELCETRSSKRTQLLEDLVPTYELIEAIQKSIIICTAN